MYSVAGCWSYCNKMLQSGYFTSLGVIFSVLEVRSPSLKCRKGWFHLMFLSLVCRCHYMLLTVPWYGWLWPWRSLASVTEPSSSLIKPLPPYWLKAHTKKLHCSGTNSLESLLGVPGEFLGTEDKAFNIRILGKQNSAHNALLLVYIYMILICLFFIIEFIVEPKYYIMFLCEGRLYRYQTVFLNLLVRMIFSLFHILSRLWNTHNWCNVIPL